MRADLSPSDTVNCNNTVLAFRWAWWPLTSLQSRHNVTNIIALIRGRHWRWLSEGINLFTDCLILEILSNEWWIASGRIEQSWRSWLFRWTIRSEQCVRDGKWSRWNLSFSKRNYLEISTIISNLLRDILQSTTKWRSEQMRAMANTWIFELTYLVHFHSKASSNRLLMIYSQLIDCNEFLHLLKFSEKKRETASKRCIRSRNDSARRAIIELFVWKTCASWKSERRKNS